MKRAKENLNHDKITRALDKKLLIPEAYPLSVVLEVTNRCNLECPLCPTGGGLSKRSVGDMPIDLAISVIKECGEFVESFSFGFLGEPLLYIHLSEAIKAATRIGCKTKMFTNLLIIPPTGFETLLDSGVHRIVISADGINESQYQFYRRGGSFETLLKNTEELVAAREKVGRSDLIIEAQMLINRSNENSVQEFETLFKGMGVDQVGYKYINLGTNPTAESAETFLPRNNEFHFYEKQGNKTTIRECYLQKAQQGICAKLYVGPVVIAWDGQYILCCRDMLHNYKVGKYPQISVWEFWNGSIMGEKRNEQHRSMIPICEQCHSLFLESSAVDPGKHPVVP